MSTSTDLRPAPLLTEHDVAERLKCSVALLRKFRARKQAPTFIKVGGRLIRYRSADVEAYINQQTGGGLE